MYRGIPVWGARAGFILLLFLRLCDPRTRPSIALDVRQNMHRAFTWWCACRLCTQHAQWYLLVRDWCADRFILKTCTRREAAFLIAALPRYHGHLMSNRYTLLCRFFGLHRVHLPTALGKKGELALPCANAASRLVMPLRGHACTADPPSRHCPLGTARGTRRS